jgi:hypothetical protein
LDAWNARLLASTGGRQIAGLATRFACADLHHDKGLQEVMKITRFGIQTPNQSCSHTYFEKSFPNTN